MVIINTDIAYLIGVLHSDAYIYKFTNKQNYTKIRLGLNIGTKSLPMAVKFQNILDKYFGIRANLRKIPQKESYMLQTSINRNWSIFQNWDNEAIPAEIKDDSLLFGAYLAGLIDGDGHVKIKNNKDRNVPQCIVKIASYHPLLQVQALIQKHLICSVHFEKENDSKCVSTCFYVSEKNKSLFETTVYPHMAMVYKVNRLDDFFKKKYGPARI